MINHDIVNAIKAHVNQEGSGYPNWYCGIASDPDSRLFSDHNIPSGENKAWWIKQNAGTEQDARDTELHLIDLGFDGGEGGGNAPVWVYAYKKIPGVTQE